MHDIFFLQSFYAFIVIIFEIPTGYLSDFLGRKKILLGACVFHGVGFSLFPFCHSLLEFIVAEFFLAIGVSLLSGTDISILYESRGTVKESKPLYFRHILGKLLFFKQMSESIAALITSFLVTISLMIPVVVQAVLSWVPLFVAIFVKDPKRTLVARKGHIDNFKMISKDLFLASHLRSLLLFNSMAYGVTSLLSVWCFQKYWADLGISISYFGFLWAFSNLLVALSGRYASLFEAKFGPLITFYFMGILPVLGWAFMGISVLFKHNLVLFFVGLFFSFGHQVCRGLDQVVLKDFFNEKIKPEFRASSNSFIGLGVRILFILWGPALGFFMDNFGLAMAFFAMSSLYVLCFVTLCIPLANYFKKSK